MKNFKKLAMMLVLGTAMNFGVCGASSDSDMLAAEQKRAEIVVAGLLGANPSAYAAQNVANVFVAEQEKAFTSDVFKTLRANCNERFGKMLDNRFASFQRFPDGDRVVYVGEFEKEKVVILGFTFDKSGKLLNFSFNPPEQPKDKKKKK